MTMTHGVYIDGAYCTIRVGNLRVIGLAEDLGRQSMIMKWSMLDACDDEMLAEYADDAIEWLNDHRSDGSGYWSWEFGDFGYWQDDDENEF